MGSILSLIPLKDWIYGAIIVALITFYNVHVHNLETQAAAHEVAALKISSDKLQQAAAKQVTQTAADYAASLSTIKGNLDEQVKVAATQHDSDAQRLRDYDAYRRQHPALGSTAGGPGSPASGAGSTISVDDVLGSMEQAGLSLATAVRLDSSALAACMADRDALTGK